MQGDCNTRTAWARRTTTDRIGQALKVGTRHRVSFRDVSLPAEQVRGCKRRNGGLWCAKWLVGMDDTRTEYELGAVRKTPIGDMRERISRTVVIRGREDFAANAFIALRMMAGPARPVQRSDSNEQRQDARLARLRALGGDRVYGRSGWRTTGDGALAKLEAEIKAARNKPFSEKSIRKDLTEAATRVQEAKRSGPFNGLVPR